MALLSHLRSLGYDPHLVSWPAPSLSWRGPPPVAVLVDLRVLGVHAPHACRAVRESAPLRKGALVAVLPEQEAPRLDLSLGFDDLLLTPYRMSELAARLRLAEHRIHEPESPDVLRAGMLTLNQRSYQVAIRRHPIELTLKEYELLRLLLRNPGRVFTRADLLERVWGDGYFGGTRTVDVHIRRLRAKTEEAGELIETVRGVGYRLVAPPE